MNKKIYFLGSVLLLSFICFSACKKTKKTDRNASEAKEVAVSNEGNSYNVEAGSSTIFWVGAKPIGSSHNGRVPVSAGEVKIENNKILSGHFEFDLNNIICDDLEGETNTMLVDHLKSADFFDVAQFPTGEFTITSAEALNDSPDSYLISGNLKLKDIEKNISFKAEITTEENCYIAKTETFYIDRTLWDVNYNSKNIFKNLKDNIINDEIEIKIEITVNRK